MTQLPFAKLIGRVVIVQFTSGAMGIGVLQRLGAQLALRQSAQSFSWVEKLPFEPSDITAIHLYEPEIAAILFLERVSNALSDFTSACGSDGRRLVFANQHGATVTLTVDRKTRRSRFEVGLKVSGQVRVLPPSMGPLGAARSIRQIFEVLCD